MKKYKQILSLVILLLSTQNVLLAQWQSISRPYSTFPWFCEESSSASDPSSASTIYWGNNVTCGEGGSMYTYFEIYKSTDTGNTWDLYFNGDYESAYLNRISFITKDTGFYERNYYMRDFIERTSDGLNTQIPCSYYNLPNGPFFRDIHMVSFEKMYAIHWDHYFMKLRDDTFRIVSTFPSNLNFYYTDIETTQDGSIYISSGSDLLSSYRHYMIFKSQDFGISWDTVFIDTTTSINDIRFSSNNKGIAVGSYGLVILTEDAGITWEIISPATNIGLRSVDNLNDSTWLAVGNSGTIISSYNGGHTWNSIVSPTNNNIIKVKCPEKDGFVFIQTDNRMWHADIDVITSIEQEVEIINDLRIWPNPTISNIQINISYMPFVKGSVLIYDLYGRLQDNISIPFMKKYMSLDISHLPSGVYIAVLKGNTKIIGRGKFIKR